MYRHVFDGCRDPRALRKERGDLSRKESFDVDDTFAASNRIAYSQVMPATIIRLLTFLGVSLGAVSACVPIVETYYEPVGHSSQSGDSPCTVSTVASFEGHGHSDVSAQVWKVHTPRSVKVLIRLNRGHTARLASPDYAIWGSATAIVQRGRIVDFAKSGCRSSHTAGCAARFQAESEMVGATAFTDRFEAEVPIPDGAGDDFFFQLPDILFDGERLSVPPIEFRRHVHGTVGVLCT